MKILVIQQKMIGDVLTSSILCEAIKKKYPSAELHYLINKHTVPVVEHNPFIDKLVIFTPEIENSYIKFFKFLQQIKAEKYDTVIDVYGKISSALITAFSRAKIRIGYHKSYSSFCYTHPIKRIKKPIHQHSLAIENRMRLLAPLAIAFQPIRPKIYLTNTEIDSAKFLLQKRGINFGEPIFMVSVLGSSTEKTYPYEYLARLLDEIIIEKPTAQLLFNYIPKQEIEVKKIIQFCKAKTQKQIFFDIFGKSLREFMALTYHCSAMVGNEGGANNMAKALGIPTFSIFAPYLNKQNWFGEIENEKHRAVHLADFSNYSTKDKADAKKAPAEYYRKMKPALIIPKLQPFLRNITL
ncbi:glycosyltransferase family 9 protein [Mesonia mobilis]|uniref:glycosyltransferase family 9 protein n=1 Tax=Mesonia mobilis TaxID=369791 RepID=UPI0026F14093|nr:glycosyltransferase family 9 protein [Mesonia mobilis]